MCYEDNITYMRRRPAEMAFRASRSKQVWCLSSTDQLYDENRQDCAFKCGSSEHIGRDQMKTEKMNCLRDHIAIFSRPKKIALHQYEKRDQLREMILDIQDVIRSNGTFHNTQGKDDL